MIPVGVAQTGTNFALINAWGDAMLTSYRSLNPDQAQFFDCTTTADHTAESPAHGDWYYDTTLDSHFMWDAYWGWRECALSGLNVGAAFGQMIDDILHRRAASTYLVDTFGPFGTDETDASKFYFWFCFRRWQPETTGLLPLKNGAVIRWEWGDTNTVSGTLSRDDPPNMTVPSNGGTPEVNPTIGYLSMSSTDGWSGVTQWKWKSDGVNFDIAGAPPTVDISSMTSLNRSWYAFTGYTESGKVFYTYDPKQFPTGGRFNAMTDTYRMYYQMELGDFAHDLGNLSWSNASDRTGTFMQAKLCNSVDAGGQIFIDIGNCTIVDLFSQAELENVSISLDTLAFSGLVEGLFYDLGGANNRSPMWDDTYSSSMQLQSLVGAANAFNGFADDMLCYEANFANGPPRLYLPTFTGEGQMKLWINSVLGGDVDIGLSGTVDHMFCYFVFSPTSVGYGTGCSGFDSLQYVFRSDFYQRQHNPIALLSGIGSHANFIKMFWNNSVFNSGTLDAMYTSLPDRSAQSAATIFIAGCPGAAGSTKSIATAKNWVVDDTTTIIDESYP